MHIHCVSQGDARCSRRERIFTICLEKMLINIQNRQNCIDEGVECVRSDLICIKNKETGNSASVTSAFHIVCDRYVASE